MDASLKISAGGRSGLRFGVWTLVARAILILYSQVLGERGSILVLTWCCSPRSCPRGEHAPRHLCPHRDPRVHPLPRGGRAPGHAGQVEQGRAAPAHREGEEGGMRGRGVCAVSARGFEPQPSCPERRKPPDGLTPFFFLPEQPELS